MKKFLQSNKQYLLLALFIMAAVVVNAQTTAVASGNWNNSATWSAGIPDASDAVTINNGVTVTVNTTAVCASITINSGGTNAGITISGTNSLTVSGAVTVNAPTTDDRNRTISVGSGSLTCASMSFGNPSNNTRDINLTIGTGTVTVTGNLAMAGGAGENAVTFSGAGTLNLGGTFTGGTVNIGTGTIRYTSSGSQEIRDMDYNNLYFSGAGTKTLPGDIIVTGNVLVEEGAVVTLGGSDIDVDVNGARSITINGTVNINGNGRLVESQGNTKTLILGATGVLNITDNGGTGLPVLNAYSFDPASTVNFGSTDAQTIENSVTYGNLTTSGSGTKTLETSGGSMTFAGTITIGSGTTLASNNKTMNVGGGFINNGTFTRGTSTVVLDGSAEQEIGGSTSTVFTNLTVNNSSLTGVTVSNDFSVDGTLTLTDGIVNTSAGNYVQIEDNATVSGASTDSHVKGPIRKAGNDAFTFPVGSGTLYSPLTITAPNETGDVFEATYMRSSGAVLGSISVSGLTQVSNCEYWDLQEVADPGNNNTLTVTIGWFPGSGCGSGYITDYTKITLAHFNGTTWSDFGGVPSGNNTTGTVQRTGISSFSPFTLGSTEAAANPLPVSFSDVKAVEKGNAVQIDWTNLTESNVESYIIERSANGVDFSAIATVAPRSNQVDRVSYSYLDMAPLAGTNFYRIKAVELDGKSIYTRNLRVDIGRSPKGISLYPNPVKGQNLTIGFSAARGMYNLQVVNNGGQVVYRQQMNHNGGTISQQLNLPASLKSGVYSLLISGDNYKESRMFVVQQ